MDNASSISLDQYLMECTKFLVAEGADTSMETYNTNYTRLCQCCIKRSHGTDLTPARHRDGIQDRSFDTRSVYRLVQGEHETFISLYRRMIGPTSQDCLTGHTHPIKA
ncbi:uncharacterized protein [Argopecten irradians]|uniref:uncharacterized protein n=1 Tax=Argopecten irradians TaxID=31199 RepID=UPI003715C36C